MYMVVTISDLNPSYVCTSAADFNVLEEIIVSLYLPPTFYA